jgi:hypothetical protein
VADALHEQARGSEMTGHAVLMKELDGLPPEYLCEVTDFVAWLKYRKLQQVPETVLLSEAVLAKDWNTPEEDEAWAGL